MHTRIMKRRHPHTPCHSTMLAQCINFAVSLAVVQFTRAIWIRTLSFIALTSGWPIQSSWSQQPTANRSCVLCVYASTPHTTISVCVVFCILCMRARARVCAQASQVGTQRYGKRYSDVAYTPAKTKTKTKQEQGAYTAVCSHFHTLPCVTA